MNYLELVFALIEARRMNQFEKREEQQDLLAIKEELARMRRYGARQMGWGHSSSYG